MMICIGLAYLVIAVGIFPLLSSSAFAGSHSTKVSCLDSCLLSLLYVTSHTASLSGT